MGTFEKLQMCPKFLKLSPRLKLEAASIFCVVGTQRKSSLKYSKPSRFWSFGVWTVREQTLRWLWHYCHIIHTHTLPLCFFFFPTLRAVSIHQRGFIKQIGNKNKIQIFHYAKKGIQQIRKFPFKPCSHTQVKHEPHHMTQ